MDTTAVDPCFHPQSFKLTPMQKGKFQLFEHNGHKKSLAGKTQGFRDIQGLAQPIGSVA